MNMAKYEEDRIGDPTRLSIQECADHIHNEAHDCCCYSREIWENRVCRSEFRHSTNRIDYFKISTMLSFFSREYGDAFADVTAESYSSFIRWFVGHPNPCLYRL